MAVRQRTSTTARYDVSSAIQAPDLQATTPTWESHQARLKTSIGPTRSQRYDQSVVMWLHNTMAVRDEYSKRYDLSSGQITMTKKDVTTPGLFIQLSIGAWRDAL